MSINSPTVLPEPSTGAGVSRYAYHAESALWDYECGQALYYEANSDHRRTCVILAEAARSALLSLQLQARCPVGRICSANLLQRLSRIRLHDAVSAALLDTHEVEHNLRRLGQILLLNRRPVGDDYLLRDFYDKDCALDCLEAAEPVLKAMTQRLLGMDLEKTLMRLWRIRKQPMVSTLLWERGAVWARRRRASFSPATSGKTA